MLHARQTKMQGRGRLGQHRLLLSGVLLLGGQLPRGAAGCASAANTAATCRQAPWTSGTPHQELHPHTRCCLMSLAKPKPLNRSSPVSALSVSSARMKLLSEGSCEAAKGQQDHRHETGR